LTILGWAFCFCCIAVGQIWAGRFVIMVLLLNNFGLGVLFLLYCFWTNLGWAFCECCIAVGQIWAGHFVIVVLLLDKFGLIVL